MSGCGCQTEQCSCHDRNTGLHGWFLEGLSPEDATEQIFPASRVRGGAGHNQAIRNQILASARAGRLVRADGTPQYDPSDPIHRDCAATGISSNLKLAQTASGLALTGTEIGLEATGAAITASALFAPITFGISALIGLFPLIFGHHAKAVKKEQSVLCTAVPAANNYLQIIDQAVHGGQATPQHGIDALHSLESDFRSQVSSIIHGSDPTSSGECNAACVMLSELRAVVLEKSGEYQDLIGSDAALPAAGAAAQTVVPARPNVTAPAGSSVPASSYASFYGQPAAPAPSSSTDWLPLAALLVGGFLLARAL